MHIYGYTDDKTVVAVDLPVKVIAKHGIDPWRLDLFDANPVSVRPTWFGEQLHFRRIQDISFAYGERDTAVIGMSNGEVPICITGKSTRNDSDNWSRVSTSEFSTSPRPFARHLYEYLTLYAKKASVLPLPIQNFVTWPADGKRVVLKGDTLEFAVADYFALKPNSQPLYCGDMFEELSYPAELPDEITWVLRALENWQPTAAGPCLRLFLNNAKVDEVDVVVRGADLRIIRKHMVEHHHVTNDALLEDSKLYFKHGDLKYYVSSDDKSITERIQSRSGSMSADGLYCREQNCIQGSRIAFFDTSKRQARLIVPPYSYRQGSSHLLYRNRLTQDERFEVIEIRKHSQ